jgi:uncharacterized protein
MPAMAPFNVIVKPVGSACNLRCDYCYYLEKYKLVMGEGENSQVMSDRMLERFTRGYIESQPEGTEEITFTWQGGEPTLLGREFFQRAVAFQQRYKRSGMRITNALQTNGTLITDDFADFFGENEFLIGVSIDGPEQIHNRYRKYPDGQGSFSQVMKGIETLAQHRVAYNTLTVVQDDNCRYPKEVYDFLTSIGSTYLQFIPIVEPGGGRSVPPGKWGSFMNTVFDRWLSRDIGSVFIQHVDLLLGRYLGYPSSLCVHAPLCGRALAVEHNGNLYSCDHFVDPEHLLGNIAELGFDQMVDSPFQTSFGKSKHEKLNPSCRSCEYLGLCYGGCLRNRLPSQDGGNDLNYLCEGYKAFYAHTQPYFKAMAAALRSKMPASEYVRFLEPSLFEGVQRNDPCPCGSGKKFKHCHGK